jgi:hypothetical protein
MNIHLKQQATTSLANIPVIDSYISLDLAKGDRNANT